MSQKRDYYEVLGVSRNASQKELKSAYRKMARQYHPDVNKEAGAADRFKEMNEAYEVLKDSDKRAQYDRFGENWQNFQGFGGIGLPARIKPCIDPDHLQLQRGADRLQPHHRLSGRNLSHRRRYLAA